MNPMFAQFDLPVNPNTTVAMYLVYLIISVALTVWVARTLHKNGRVFLVDSYHPVRLPGDTQERALNDGRRFRARVARHGGILYASGVRSGRGQGR